MARTRIAALVAVLAAVLGGLTVAHAGALTVTSQTLTAQVVAHPCPGTARLTAATSGTAVTGTSVRVTLPDACAGLPVDVSVLDGATRVASGTATAQAGATVVPVTRFTATPSLTARVTVRGWHSDAVWQFTMPYASCRIPSAPTATCTVTAVSVTNGTWLETLVNPEYHRVAVTFTSDQAAPAPWEVTLNFADSARYRVVPSSLGSDQALTTTATCAGLPVAAFRGSPTTTSTSFGVVGSGQTRTFTLHVDSILTERRTLLSGC